MGGGDRRKQPPEDTALTVLSSGAVPTNERCSRTPRPTPPPDIPGVHYHLPGPSWEDFGKEKFGHGITVGVVLGLAIASLVGIGLWTVLAQSAP